MSQHAAINAQRINGPNGLSSSSSRSFPLAESALGQLPTGHKPSRVELHVGRRGASRASSSPSSMSSSLSCLLMSFMAILCLLAGLMALSAQASSELLHRRVKRALYELPDGAEQILGNTLRTTFTCDGLGYGYYADQDNDCKIFHICQSFKMSDGSIYNNHWSFMCGNQTVFNQVALACSHPEDSIPCENAKEFYHVNDYFGDLRAPSVKEADLSLASDLITRSYGSRLAASGNQ